MKDEELTAIIENKVEELVAKRVDEIKGALEQESFQNIGLKMADIANEDSRFEMDPGTGYAFGLVPIDSLDFNPLSDRPTEELDPAHPGIQSLKDEIERRWGLNRAPLVYRKDGRYMIVKGHKRIVALREMGEELVRVYILPAKPPIDMEKVWVNGY